MTDAVVELEGGKPVESGCGGTGQAADSTAAIACYQGVGFRRIGILRKQRFGHERAR